MDSFLQLKSQLDIFIRKYYSHLLVRGVLLSLFSLSILLMLLLSIEAWGYFSSSVRLILLIVFCISTFIALVWGIFWPLSKIFSWSKQMSYESAESIIKTHFPEINDRLRNLLELHKSEMDLPEGEILLLRAAVEQKIFSLGDMQFTKKIPLKRSFYALRWTVIPFFLILLGFIFFPQSTTFPARRVLHYQQYFERPVPFAFEVLNEELVAIKGEDFVFRVKSVGREIPDEVYVTYDGRRFRMDREDKLHFSFRFVRLQKSLCFQLQIADVLMPPYHLLVRPLPGLFSVQIALEYPAYMARKNELLQQFADMQLPRGTRLRYQWNTKDADSLLFMVDDRSQALSPNTQGRFSNSLTISSDLRIAVLLTNRHAVSTDTLFAHIECIDDKFPIIYIEEFKDSTTPNFSYFKGLIRDDYGFSSLKMIVVRSHESHDTLEYPLFFDSSASHHEFVEHFDFSTLLENDGMRFSYYFEVADNDALSGFKTARSAVFQFSPLTVEEREQSLNQQSLAVMERMQQTLAKVQSQQNALESLVKKMLEKPELSWEERKQFERLREEQSILLQEHDKLKEALDRQLIEEQHLSEEEEKILEKKAQLESLFDLVFTPEMKQMMEELQQLMMQEMSKDKLERSLQQIQMNNKEIEKQLDQNLEVFKRMEVERQLDQVLDRLARLKSSQEKLRQDVSDQKIDAAQSLQKQEQLGEDFRSIREQMNEIEKMRKELESPLEFSRPDSLEQQVANHMRKAQQKQKEGRFSEVRELREQTEQAIENLHEDIATQLDQAQAEQAGEDADKIRSLLKRIVQTSLDQEANFSQLKRIRVNDPLYPQHLRTQGSLTEAIRTLSDSLYALGKRQPQVASVVNAELKTLVQQTTEVMAALQGMNDVMYQRSALVNSQAIAKEQYVMTSLNNLSLLLAESLRQMEQQQKRSKGRSNKNKPSCANPSEGAGQSKPSSTREMQEALNRQLEQMKRGQPQPQGQGASMSEQLARMAAQQEAIRRMMQKQAEAIGKKDGKAASELRSIMEEMEHTEQDLVNRRISDQTLQRQAKILTRMLESEKAQLKDGQDESRRSTEAREIGGEVPRELLDFMKHKAKEKEWIQKYHILLAPYYQQKMHDYLNKPSVPRETPSNP